MAEETPQDQDTQLAVALYDYRRAVRTEFGYIDVQKRGNFENVSKIEIGRQFVFPQLSPRRISPREEPSAWGETTPLLTALKEFPTLTVLGDPGSGKSTIVAWIAQMLADPGPNIYKTTFPGVVPLPFVLRDLPLSAKDQWPQLLEAFLTQGFAENLNIDQVRRLLDQGRAFVLVDGLDEVSDPEVRIAVRNALLELQLWNFSGNRWLFTSRIVGYTSDSIYGPALPEQVYLDGRPVPEEVGEKIRGGRSEVKKALQVLHDRPLVADFGGILAVEPPLRYVTPFLPDAVAQFAKNWFNLREPEPANAEKRAREFLAALASRSDLSELARTPQLLGMICLVHYYQARLPDGRAELYQSVVRAYLIDIPRIIGRDIAVDPEDRIRWLSAIGFQMQRQRRPRNELSKYETMVPVFTSRTTKKHDDVGVTVPEPTLRGWLKDIHVAEDQIDVFVHFLGRRAGLLLPRGKDEAGNEVYAFLHLSFQEYFAASYLADRDPTQPQSSALASLRRAGSPGSPGIARDDVFAWSKEPMWQETFRLLFQIHGPSQADNLAGELFMEFQGIVLGAVEVRTGLVKKIRRLIDGEFNGNADKKQLVGNMGFLLSDVVLDGKARITTDTRRILWSELLQCEIRSQRGSHKNTSGISCKNEKINIAKLLNCCGAAGGCEALSGVFKGVTGLDLSDSEISDLETIKGLNQLNVLDLSGTKISDLESLQLLTNLTTLHLTHTRVSDLWPIRPLSQLTSLNLRSTNVRDLSPLQKLSELRILNVENTLVSDLDPITHLSKLTNVYLAFAHINDLEPLAALSALKVLDVTRAQVSDLRPIERLDRLESLDLTWTEVHDLRPISGLSKLTSLSLKGTQVIDLTPIKELKRLGELVLSDTKVTDLSPLRALAQLKTLYLSGTRVSDAQKEDLKKRLPNLTIYE